MGLYINENSKGKTIGNSFVSKVMALVTDGALAIETPTKFYENLIIVVDNGAFAAIAYAYDENEMEHFISGINGRDFQWFVYPYAKQLAK